MHQGDIVDLEFVVVTTVGIAVFLFDVVFPPRYAVAAILGPVDSTLSYFCRIGPSFVESPFGDVLVFL